MKWNNGINKKEIPHTPTPHPPPKPDHPIFIPLFPPSLGSYKVNIFCLFPIKS